MHVLRQRLRWLQEGHIRLLLLSPSPLELFLFWEGDLGSDHAVNWRFKFQVQLVKHLVLPLVIGTLLAAHHRSLGVFQVALDDTWSLEAPCRVLLSRILHYLAHEAGELIWDLAFYDYLAVATPTFTKNEALKRVLINNFEPCEGLSDDFFLELELLLRLLSHQLIPVQFDAGLRRHIKLGEMVST